MILLFLTLVKSRQDIQLYVSLLVTCQKRFKCFLNKLRYNIPGLGLWCLTPLSTTIFLLYRGGQFFGIHLDSNSQR